MLRKLAFKMVKIAIFSSRKHLTQVAVHCPMFFIYKPWLNLLDNKEEGHFSGCFETSSTSNFPIFEGNYQIKIFENTRPKK